MARTVRNAKIDTRSARSKLALRSEPYWTVVSAGCALGYRRGKTGGSWVARWRSKGGIQHYETLGAADDGRDADGVSAFSYAQIQERARSYFDRKVKEERGDLVPNHGPYTVANALTDYFAAQRHKGAKAPDKDEKSANARILPDLGRYEVSSLTTQKLRRWHQELATKPKLLRTSKHVSERNTKALAEGDTDAVRSRRATANRVLTILKAALNLAYHDGRVASDDAWRKLKPFKAVDSVKIRYLSPDECRRLIAACTDDFARLAHAALLTGCRYGELISLKISDVYVAAGTIHIKDSKSGRPRHVVLTSEGVGLFVEVIASRSPSALVFLKANGKPWKTSQQARPIADASSKADIEPPVTFHVLRHTHGSALAMAGTPMGVIAKQLGHSDTRMTERHYAHLSPSYVADTIRANLPRFCSPPLGHERAAA